MLVAEGRSPDVPDEVPDTEVLGVLTGNLEGVFLNVEELWVLSLIRCHNLQTTFKRTVVRHHVMKANQLEELSS